MRVSLRVAILSTLSTITLICSSLLAQINPYTVPATSDSSKVTTVEREVKPSRSTWEEVAFFPGRLIYFPLKYTLKGAGKLVGYVDDTKIVPRIEDKLESDDGRRQLKFTYASRYGGGVKYYERGILSEQLDRNIATVTASSGIKREMLFQASFAELLIPRSPLVSDHLIRYKKSTDESYFGSGMSSLQSPETKFTLEQTTVETKYAYNLSNNESAFALIGFEHSNITKGYDSGMPSTVESYSESTLPGLTSPVSMIHGGLMYQHDSKKRDGNPTDGSEISVSGVVHKQVNNNDFSFVKYGFDIRHFVHLFYSRVLILRIATEINNPFKGKEVPFYYQSELGSESTIRGFENGRFRDRDMILTTAEYRYPLWRSWHEKGVDMLLFTDIGQVSSNLFSSTRIDNFQLGYGFGFRLWDWKDGLVAKFQIGWSDQGVRLNLGLN